MDWMIEAAANELGLSWLTGIYGFGTGDIWAVGDVGILHRQSGVWTLENAPLTADDSVNNIWGPSPDVLYAVADTSGSYWEGLILEYSNGSWVRVDDGIALDPVFGIWGSGPQDIWLVGHDGTIVNNDGTGWNNLYPAAVGDDGLYAVWGSNPDIFWMAGSYGALYYSYYGACNHASLTTNNHLYDLWGSSFEDVWAVGNNGTILHFDGNIHNMWDRVPSSTEECLYGICGDASDNIWAVGAAGTVVYYNGVSWEQLPPPTTYQLNKCWINDQGQVWIVGEAGIIIRH